jgi:hypothetical protein
LDLFWDPDARNHEVTLLKIKHIRLKEHYGGEIPHEAKTATGPILLTCSFPYVRDWLNEHPFRNEPDAKLICNSYTGGSNVNIKKNGKVAQTVLNSSNYLFHSQPTVTPFPALST